jgi:hypothetical protein
MKKKSKKDKQLKTESVEILVTPDVKKAIREVARQNYTSDGNYCRQIIVEELRRHRLLVRPGEK